MRLILAFLLAVIASGCANQSFSDNDQCDNGYYIEVAEQKFSFDLSKIKNIKVLNFDTASTHLEFKSEYFSDMHIYSTNERYIVGGINERGGYEKIGVNSLIELFEKAKIKGSAEDEDYFGIVKNVMHINDPSKITIHKENSRVIIILEDAYDDGSDAIYILRNKDDRIIVVVTKSIDFNQLERLKNIICI